jgi:hypothetical protein
LRRAAALVALLACSCNSSPALYPVRGSVFVDGKPAEGAVVVFHRVGETALNARKPSGRVGKDGTFTLTTHTSGDGAEAGEYLVAIAWLGDASRINSTTGEVPVRLSPKYADPKSSNLRATVKEGTNELPPYRLPK